MLLTLDLLTFRSRLSGSVAAGSLCRCPCTCFTPFVYSHALCGFSFMAPLCALLFLNKCLWVFLFWQLFPSPPYFIPPPQWWQHMCLKKSTWLKVCLKVRSDDGLGVPLRYCSTPKLPLFLRSLLVRSLCHSLYSHTNFQISISHEVCLLAGTMSSTRRGNNPKDR